MAMISPGSISLLAIVYLPCNSVCSIVTASENLKKCKQTADQNGNNTQ